MCSKYKTEKEVSLFYKSKTTKDGLYYRCKYCDYLDKEKWIKNNPEKHKKTINNWNMNNPEKQLFRSARYRAKNKSFEFDLELQDILIPEYCPIFGIRLENHNSQGNQSAGAYPNSSSIDRIDNTKVILREILGL